MIVGSYQGTTLTITALNQATGSATPRMAEYFKHATDAMRRGDLRGARTIVDEAVEAGSDSDPIQIWELRFIRARLLEAAGQVEGALNYLNSFSPPPMELTEIRSRLMMYLATFEGYLGHDSVADQLVSQAFTVAFGAGLDAVAGEIYLAEGFIRFRRRDYASSDRAFRLALEISEKAGGWYLRGHGLWGIGKNLMIQEHYLEAVPWLERALALFEKAGEPLYVAMVWSELGVCYLGFGNDSKAMDLLRQAERVYAEAGVIHNYQVVLANIGNVYLHRKEYFTAIDYYQRALTLARQIKDQVSVKKWTRNINLAYARIRASVDQQSPRIA